VIYAYGILNLVESSLKLRSDVQWTFVGHTFAGTESNHEECSLSGDRHAEDNRSRHLEDGVSGSVRMRLLSLFQPMRARASPAWVA
jgi:hypothetical protein